MVRVRLTTLLITVACLTLSIAYADDSDAVTERVQQAHDAYQAEIELIREEAVKELETKDTAERKRATPDLERIKSLKNERELLETKGTIPTSVSVKLKNRINKNRAKLVTVLTTAKSDYLRAKQDGDAEAIALELQELQKAGNVLPLKPTATAKATTSKPDPSKPWGKPEFVQWTNQVAALTAQRQVEAVSKKLVELNPGFDGVVTPAIEGETVIGVTIPGANLTDLSPLRALRGLKVLACSPGKLTDLSPLRGTPLTNLTIHSTTVSDLSPLKGMQLTHFNCAYTPVTDLSPLKGMPLIYLVLQHTQVSDLSPLQGMPLATLSIHSTKVSDLSQLKGLPLTNLGCIDTPVSDLTPLKGMHLTALWIHRTKVTDYSLLKELPVTDVYLDFDPVRDTKLLRSIKTLTVINGIAAAEFWKKLEAPAKK